MTDRLFRTVRSMLDHLQSEWEDIPEELRAPAGEVVDAMVRLLGADGDQGDCGCTLCVPEVADPDEQIWAVLSRNGGPAS